MCKMKSVRCNVLIAMKYSRHRNTKKIKFLLIVKFCFTLLRLFPHHPGGRSHWRIVFLAATAVQEAHLSVCTSTRT